MKEILKRLSSGFISSLMVMSFVLMPIPNVSVVYAEDANVGTDGLPCPTEDDYKKGAVYKAGCEFSAALSTTTFDSSARYQDGKKVFGVIPEEWISQYIVGLMGVVLINSLSWTRLSKYNVKVYGNDCPKNIGPLVTMNTSLVSALLYMIGDIQSNIQFKEAAQKAADEYDMELSDLQSFTAKEKVWEVDTSSGADSDEKAALEQQLAEAKKQNNAQETGYDALAKVLKGQLKALKTKRNLAGASAIGYGLSDVLELANMGWMHSICASQWSSEAVAEAKEIAEFTSAMSAATTAAAGVYTTAICADAPAQIGSGEAQKKAAKVANMGKSTAYSFEVAKKSVTLMDAFNSIFSSIKSIFPGAKTASELSKVTKSVGDKASDIASESIEVTERVARDSADISAATAYLVGTRLNDTAADKCVPIKMVEDNASANFPAYMTTPVVCCGGPGVNEVTFAFANSQKLAGSNIAALAKNEAKGLLRKKLVDEGFNALLKEVTGGVSELAKKLVDKTVDKELNDNKRYEGSYFWQGVPTGYGAFSLQKDVKVKSLFGESSTTSTNNSPELNKKQKIKLENLKFYARNMFESNLRGLMIRLAPKVDKKKPMESLKQIVDTSKKIDRVMLEFDKYLDSDFLFMLRDEKVNNNSLAFKKVINKVMSELFIPQANAGMLSIAAGAGLSMAGGMVDGPWGEVLNVGGKVVLLHGIIGKFAKRYALVSPVSRAVTWTTLGLMSNWSKNLANNAYAQVEKNLKVVEAEKKRFKESGANASGNLLTGTGTGELNLKSNESNANKKGSMNIKQCAVANGDEFLPAPCNQITPRESFQVSGVSTSGSLESNPIGFAHSVMTDTAFGSSNDPTYASSLTSGQTANLDKAQKAMADLADKKRKIYDDMMKESKAYKDAGGESLQAQIGKLKKVLFNDGITGGSSDIIGGANSAAIDDTMASAKPANKLGTGSKVGGDSSSVSAQAVAPAVPTFDLDFGDTSVDDGTKAASGKSKKKEGRLDDYVVKHNDINKRKDVSIFKILSNRYILSYPKVLEEVKQ